MLFSKEYLNEILVSLDVVGKDTTEIMPATAALNDADFAERIREHYQDKGGLTGVFAIGGTRTTYILEKQRHLADPGHLNDMNDQIDYIQSRYHDFISMFQNLGGQNMVIAASSFRAFAGQRGPDYIRWIAEAVSNLHNESFQRFYRQNGIDPYFIGIDVFLAQKEDSPARKTAEGMQEFQKSWPYAPGRFKLVWEIAPVCLYSLINAIRADDQAELDSVVAETGDLEKLFHQIYERYAPTIYGTEMPLPDFYLGTNKSGDIKIRSPMPFTLTGGEYMRSYYTPYPTLFMRQETLRYILNDLAFGERFQSLKADYSGRYTSELAQAEYARVIELSSHAENTVGLSRRLQG